MLKGLDEKRRKEGLILFCSVLEEEWAVGSLGIDLSRRVGAVECILEWCKCGCEK